MHDTADLTKPQRIILAAAGLPEPFHESALVEAAWKADPRAFGMRTMEARYPDLNNVRTYLVGDRGLVGRGIFEKRGALTYALTSAGRKLAERLTAGGDTRFVLGRVQPGRDCEARLTRALMSRAVIRTRSGQRDTLNYADALDFWGAKAGDSPVVIDALRDVLERYVREAGEAIVSGVCRFRSGQEVRAGELTELSRVNAWLGQRFGRELERGRKAVPA